MVGTNFIDEIDCGNFFDQIDDFLDFPIDDVEAGLESNLNSNSFPSIWTTESDSLPGSDSVFSGNSGSDLSTELSVPYEDIVELEWLSNIVDDSFTVGSLTMKKEDDSIDTDPSHNQFQTSSPISVLESSSSCSGEKNVPHSPKTITPARCGRARSKRPRPATFNPRPAVQLISPTSSVTDTANQLIAVPKDNSNTDNFAESVPLIKMPKQVSTEHKKKKIKFKMPLPPAETNQNTISQAVRKCMHCEITKTPQWRAGPMGPKTLCNACGVRYKSGRLFPEYRPAASPTYIPLLHSNSHKKVLEMRIKAFESPAENGMATDMIDTPELIPNTNCSISLDYM